MRTATAGAVLSSTSSLIAYDAGKRKRG